MESLNNYAIIVLKPHLLGITATSGYTDTSSGLVMKLPTVALVTTSSEGQIGLNILSLFWKLISLYITNALI